MIEAAVKTVGLKKSYGRVNAVNGLDLEVAQGGIYGFLGPNGAGKTTTCRILTTLTKPSQGKAFVSGFDVVENPVSAKKGMGLVPQHINLDPDLSIYQNLKLHGMLHKMPKPKMLDRIKEMLDFTDLWERRNELAKGLSGGFKRRLMIARALMHEPRVLFLDEPTVGLDAHTRRRMWELIRKSHEGGVTVFLTTHYIEEAENLCHRVGIIDQGKLIAQDTPQGFLASTGKVVVEPVFGASDQTGFFEDRKQAAQYAASLKGDTVIRASNLEDVFINLTGRSVSNNTDKQDSKLLSKQETSQKNQASSHGTSSHTSHSSSHGSNHGSAHSQQGGAK